MTSILFLSADGDYNEKRDEACLYAAYQHISIKENNIITIIVSLFKKSFSGANVTSLFFLKLSKVAKVAEPEKIVQCEERFQPKKAKKYPAL